MDDVAQGSLAWISPRAGAQECWLSKDFMLPCILALIPPSRFEHGCSSEQQLVLGDRMSADFRIHGQCQALRAAVSKVPPDCEVVATDGRAPMLSRVLAPALGVYDKGALVLQVLAATFEL